MYKDVQGAKVLHNKGQVRCVRSAELYWKDPPQCRCERERNPKTKNNKMFDTTLKLNNAEQGSGEFSWQCCHSGNTITYTNNVQYRGSYFSSLKWQEWCLQHVQPTWGRKVMEITNHSFYPCINEECTLALSYSKCASQWMISPPISLRQVK